MLANGELQYDYLVIGLGAVPETFGIKGLKEYAFPIANINTSRLLREHIEPAVCDLQYGSGKTAGQVNDRCWRCRIYGN